MEKVYSFIEKKLYKNDKAGKQNTTVQHQKNI